MTANRQDRLKLSEEAAAWVLRLDQETDARHRGEFFDWLRQSPRHMEEFMFARAVSVQLGRMAPGEGAPVDVDALAALRDDAIVELERNDSLAVSAGRNGRTFGLSRRWLGLAATIAVALSLWALHPAFSPSGGTYSTSTGGQQSVKLSDGSLMQLNTHSRAEVHFSGSERQVRLLEGEALFAVAQDRARPFRVVTGTAVIQAIGTQFNVYRRPEGTRVSVIEGVVQISRSAAPAPGEAVRLEAGSEADITPERVSPQDKPDIERALAWRTRRLMFHGDRLDHVVREFNRYNALPIRLDDASIADRQISGVFDADDPQPLIEFLTRQPAFEVMRTDREILIRARR